MGSSNHPLSPNPLIKTQNIWNKIYVNEKINKWLKTNFRIEINFPKTCQVRFGCFASTQKVGSGLALNRFLSDIFPKLPYKCTRLRQNISLECSRDKHNGNHLRSASTLRLQIWIGDNNCRKLVKKVLLMPLSTSAFINCISCKIAVRFYF